MFFQRDEIKLMIGCLMLMFPKYVIGLEKEEYQFLQPEHYRYYRSCVMVANAYLEKPEAADFRNCMPTREASRQLERDDRLCLLRPDYQMFEFAPFSTLLGTDMRVGVVDIRPARNIALFTQIIGKFEYLHRISVLDGTEYRGRRESMLIQNTYLIYIYVCFLTAVSQSTRTMRSTRRVVAFRS